MGPNSKLVDENTMDCASAQGLPKPQVYSDVLLLWGYTYHSPVLSEVISADVFHVVCKAFIEPQIIPPLHCHQVPKPLVRKLVRDDDGDILLVSGARGGRVTKQVGLPECE